MRGDPFWPHPLLVLAALGIGAAFGLFSNLGGTTP